MISPRTNEVNAVVELLESEDFDSAEALAKAIVKAVAAELVHRDTLGVAAGFDGNRPVLAVGPFYSQKDVQAWVSEATEVGLQTRVARLSSPDSLRPSEARKGPCSGCGHESEMHNPRWGCGVFPVGKTKCQCKEGK